MAGIAEELSKICRLLELGNKEYQAVYTDLRQKESSNAFSVSGVTLAANRLPKPGKTHSRRVSQCEYYMLAFDWLEQTDKI